VRQLCYNIANLGAVSPIVLSRDGNCVDSCSLTSVY